MSFASSLPILTQKIKTKLLVKVAIDHETVRRHIEVNGSCRCSRSLISEYFGVRYFDN